LCEDYIGKTTYILTLPHKTDDAFGGRRVCRTAKAGRNYFPKVLESNFTKTEGVYVKQSRDTTF
jgi:hypothetical protein